MPDYNITTGLPQLPAGLPEAEFNLVKPLYIAMNTLAQSVSVSAGKVSFNQSELAQQNQLATILTQNHRKINVLAVGSALGFGKIVNLYLSTGKIAAQLADATDNTKPAHGIVSASAGIAVGEYGEVDLIEGYTTGISGTTFGLYYYLSTVGNVQAGPPSAVGSIVQPCGFGLGSAGFYLHIIAPIKQN